MLSFVRLEVASFGESLQTDFAFIPFLSRMSSSMLCVVALQRELFATSVVPALIRLLSGVRSCMDCKIFLVGKGFPTSIVLALEWLLASVLSVVFLEATSTFEELPTLKAFPLLHSSFAAMFSLVPREIGFIFVTALALVASKWPRIIVRFVVPEKIGFPCKI